MAKQNKANVSKVDAFQRIFIQLARWAKSNVRQIVIVLAPLLVAVVAVVIGQTYLSSQKNKRLAALATINRVYEDEQQVAADRRAALQEKIKKIKAIAPEDAKQDKPAELQELEAQLKAVRAEHSRSAEQYQEFFATHQTSPEGWAAAMSAIGIAITSKQHTKARDLLKNLLKQSTKSDFYQVQARLLYIKLLEEQGEVEQALQETEQVYRLAPKDFKADTLLLKARLLLAQKQDSAALAVCEDIIKDYADSSAAIKARAIKVLLN